MAEIIKNGANWSVIVQALIIAAITATATGYVSAKVLESKVDYLAKELIRIDKEGIIARNKIEEIAIRQAAAIGQSNIIHDQQARRIERMEDRRR